MLILHSVSFGVCGSRENGGGVNYHAAVFGGFGGNAKGGEGGTEDWDKGWGDVIAEGCAN